MFVSFTFSENRVKPAHIATYFFNQVLRASSSFPETNESEPPYRAFDVNSLTQPIERERETRMSRKGTKIVVAEG